MPLRPKQQLIDKSRLISGLLSEMDAADVAVWLSKDSETFAIYIDFELKSPFDTSLLRIRDASNIPHGVYSAIALFTGQRFEFEIKVVSDDGLCSLPSKIIATELRSEGRQSFGPTVESAEIFTRTGVVMAVPIDMNRSTIALYIHSKNPKIEISEKVKLVIRSNVLQQDVFTGYVCVADLRKDKHTTKVLLSRMSEYESSQPMRKITRHPGQGLNVTIGPSDETLGPSFHATVLDISMSGLRLSIPDFGKKSWIQPGLIIKMEEYQTIGVVIHYQDNFLGVHVVGLENAENFRRWSMIVDKNHTSKYHHSSQSEDLLKLFKNSTLLKQSRREIYGNLTGEALPPNNFINNKLLYRRIIETDQNSIFTGHISVVRMTDDMWIFQEGAYIGTDKNGYEDLFREAIVTSREMYLASNNNNRFLCGLYHKTVKTVDKIGEKIFSDSSITLFSMLVVNSQNIAKTSTTNGIEEVVPTRLTASQRRTFESNFDPVLIEAFLGRYGNHSVLNAELSKIGPHHKVRSVYVVRGNETIAIAYRFFSYYSLNITGVLNSLFIILASGAESSAAQACIESLSQSPMAFGTSDIAIVCSSQQSSSIGPNFPQPKPFTLFIIDHEHNQELLGAEVEGPSLSKMRK